MKPTTYRSSISPILWTFIWLIIGVVFYLTVKPAFSHPNIFHAILLMLIWVPMLGFLVTVMLGTRYRLNRDELTIKVGPITEGRILPEDIWMLERTYHAMASPANGLKRIRITHAEGELLVSPANERKFIEHLKAINPKIEEIGLT
ncbi:MAG: PH domain-containing protein [Cytophagales bacterium]|nr:PH domain-containing protein [Cytophagales bacterium]